jgi:hypothetical protein
MNIGRTRYVIELIPLEEPCDAEQPEPSPEPEPDPVAA